MNWINAIMAMWLTFLANEDGNIGFMGGGSEGGGDNSGSGAGDNSDAGGAGGSDGGGNAGDNGSGGPAPTFSFPDGVTDEEVLSSGDTVFKNFWKDGKLDQNAVLKSYIHTQRLIGGEKMVIPNNNSSDEQWRDTFHKLGLPADIEGYEVKNNLPEGHQANEKLFNGFKEVAHKAGILPNQAQSVIDYFNQTVAEQVKASNQSYIAEREAEAQALKDKWGQAYDRKLKAAEYGIEQFASEDQIKYFAEMGLMEDPKFTELWAAVGESLSEDGFAGDDGRPTGDQMTPDEIRKEIQGMYHKDHPFKNPKHPEHKRATDRFLKLQTMLHGNKVVAGGGSQRSIM
jgi:hypothetical protein